MDGTRRDNEPPAGAIRRVLIRDVIAHGAGTSAINGHPDSWLDVIRLENIRLYVSHDPHAPYDDTRSAMMLRHARNVTMKDVEIRWEAPHSASWQTGLQADQVSDLLLDGAGVAGAPSSAGTAITLKDAENVTVRDSRAPTLHVAGTHSRNIRLLRTEAKINTDASVPKGAVLQQ